jgi:hypothetical protein
MSERVNEPSVIGIGSGVIGLRTAWSLVHADTYVAAVVSQHPRHEIGWDFRRLEQREQQGGSGLLSHRGW